ncbi:Foldase protein prsA 2 precursor [Mycobacteroides abscessus subsp. abscessus]|jgi:foldase protein PrsA|nr:Foldase protein prsA 2 precursor [Mycobacteroides abscessus subsp. abscessus]
MVDKKYLKSLVVGLLLLNIVTIIFFLSRDNGGSKEVVATIGNETITRQEWLGEMEERYGRDVLSEMIDQKAIAQLANKYDISISKKAVDRELLLVKTMYGSGSNEMVDEEKWRQQIQYSIMLDELLTKDVVVEEGDLKKFYEENSSLYKIPTAYHLSHIIVETEEEAKKAIEELEQGTSFEALAMERSIDEFSANQGGDIGYVSEEMDQYARDYLAAVQKLKENEWAGPIKTDNGFSIVLLHDQIKGRTFEFNDVKESIRRQIALEQMDVTTTARDFWEEAKVDWFYEQN